MHERGPAEVWRESEMNHTEFSIILRCRSENDLNLINRFLNKTTQSHQQKPVNSYSIAS